MVEKRERQAARRAPEDKQGFYKPRRTRERKASLRAGLAETLEGAIELSFWWDAMAISRCRPGHNSTAEPLGVYINQHCRGPQI